MYLKLSLILYHVPAPKAHTSQGTIHRYVHNRDNPAQPVPDPPDPLLRLLHHPACPAPILRSLPAPPGQPYHLTLPAVSPDQARHACRPCPPCPRPGPSFLPTPTLPSMPADPTRHARQPCRACQPPDPASHTCRLCPPCPRSGPSFQPTLPAMPTDPACHARRPGMPSLPTRPANPTSRDKSSASAAMQSTLPASYLPASCSSAPVSSFSFKFATV